MMKRLLILLLSVSCFAQAPMTNRWEAGTDTGSVNASAVALLNCPGTLPNGMQVSFYPANSNTNTAPTLAVCGGTAYTITNAVGGALCASDISPGTVAVVNFNANAPRWELQNPHVCTTINALPSGMIVFIDGTTLSSCPAGWTQVAQSGNYLLMTVAANSDAGTTGGSNSYTPAGTNSAPTFSGTQDTTSATSAGTPAGTNASGAFTEGAISWPAGVPTASGAAFSVTTTHENSGSSNYVATAMGGTTLASGTTSITLSTQPTIAWPSGVPTIAAGTFTQPTFTGSALGTHTHTVTPTGTVSAPTFSGTGATITPTYYKVIPCRKN